MSPSFQFSIVPLVEVLGDESIVFSEPNRRIVLVVDDERIIADTLSIILRKHGYEVLTAYNGATALDLAYDTPPDLLLSDVVMPGMTGIELAIILTKAMPACKVLLFSGQASTVDLLVTAQAFGHDFNVMTKPVHPTDILRQIEERLAENQMLAMD
jgi:CheY-like chemotaxis protein